MIQEIISALFSKLICTYFQAYQHLCLLDRQNKANFNVINSAIFAFAFDDVETFELQDVSYAEFNYCCDSGFQPVINLS